MEKTKFELECEDHCSQCIKQSMDICNLPGHCKEEAELTRCGICGNIYCSEEAMTEHNICATCESNISRNVDANNELVNAISLFQNKYLEIKKGGFYEIPIGAKVKCEGKTLECCESPKQFNCQECFLHQHKLMNYCLTVCRDDQREDKKNTVLKLSK